MLRPYRLIRVIPHPIPDQSRIEGHGGEHGQDYHQGEMGGGRARFDVGQRPEFDQGDEDRHHVDVDHRPAADDFGHAVEAGAFRRPPMAAPLHRNQQVGEHQQLEQGDEDAGDENDQGDGPTARGEEIEYPAHDGVTLHLAEKAGMGHRQQIGGEVEDRRRQHQRPTARRAVGLAPMHAGAAARAAVPGRGKLSDGDQPIADMAGGQSGLFRGQGHQRFSSASQTRCGSMAAKAAVRTTISAPKA